MLGSEPINQPTDEEKKVSGNTRRRLVSREELDVPLSLPPPPFDANALRRLAESATRLEQLEDASVFRTIAPGFEMPAREAKNLCIVRIIG